jgi:hypothetical protein
MPRKHFAVAVALMIGSDLYLNYKVYGLPLTWDQTLIWAWYVGVCMIGTLLRDRIKPLYVAGAALGSAVSFFLLSNFGVWASGYVGYPKTLAGLMASYVAAIPFFEKGLLSDLIFSAAFFSIPVLAAHFRRVSAHENAAA